MPVDIVNPHSYKTHSLDLVDHNAYFKNKRTGLLLAGPYASIIRKMRLSFLPLLAILAAISLAAP